MSDTYGFDLQRFFLSKPAPVLLYACDADGCGRPVLAVYQRGAEHLLVVDIGDFRYRVHESSFENAPPRAASDSDRYARWQAGERVDIGPPMWKVHRFREPIVYEVDQVRWPVTARCREHGSLVVDREEVVRDLMTERRHRGVHVHPR